MTRVWLLDVELGGRTLRLSTQPVVANGRAYAGTLDRVELRETLDGIGRLPSEREAQLTFAPGAALTAYGQIQGRATLRLWSGTGQGVVQLEGFLRGAEIAGATEPLSATLTAEAYADRGSTHDPEARVSGDPTWSAARSNVIGHWYPRIYGTPSPRSNRGGIRLDAVATSGASGTEERATRLLICDAVNHSQPLRVQVWADDGSAVDRVAIFGASDPQPAAVSELGAGTVPAWVLDTTDGSLPTAFRDAPEFYCNILDNQAPNYGSASRSPPSTVGEILRTLVRESDLVIDEGEWARLAEDLPYPAGRVIREPSSPMDLAMDLLSQFPAALYSSPRGLAVVRWPYDATRADAVARLREGVNCSRLSGIRLMREPSEAAGTIIVEYGYSERTETYSGSAVVTQDLEAAVTQANAGTNVWIRTADRDGAVETIEAPWLIDESGAFEVARWASRKLALGARELDAMIDADIAAALPLASVVLVDVPSLALTDAVAIVAGRTLTDGGAWPVRLVLLSPVGLDRQTTPTGAQDVAPPVTPDPAQ